MIIHIPHSSRDLCNSIKLEKEQENLDILTDNYVLDLFDIGSHVKVIFPYSRFVCDVERLKNDPMNEIGQGIIYNKDIFSNNIERNIDDNKVYEMYENHHKKLINHINFGLPLFDNVILLDAHTFTPYWEDDPDICIGTCDIHTPKEISNHLIEYFNDYNLTVKFNSPFKGTLVPDQFYNKTENLISIMIEVNQKTIKNSIKKMKKIIEGAINILEKYE